MQCNTCGTQLPGGAAYCPTCGNMTPYHISFSGVNPSETTVTSFSAPSSPHSSAQQPFSTPPPPLRRHRRSVWWILLVVFVLLIIGVGSVRSFQANSSSHQPTAHASPTPQVQQATATLAAQTPQAQQATATPAAQSPQELYNQVTQSPPMLDDPLDTNGSNNWTENASAGGKSRCQFTGKAYHSIAQTQNTSMLCTAQATHFGDLAYQVQMTITKGDLGGIVFRIDGSQTKYYSFFIDRSANYTLITSIDDTGKHDYALHKGTSSFIKTDLDQVNLLAIIARGSTISLYINQQYITSASDSTYSAGQIGLFGGTTTSAQADVLFRHVQVWNV